MARRLHFLFALLLTLAAPARATAQESADPCLQALAADTQALGRYDQLVGEFLQARDAADPDVQLAILARLWDTCDANLRIKVFEGDAYAARGDCVAAMTAYDFVRDNATRWPHADNATDAATRAETGRNQLRNTCIAAVEIRCATANARVRLGDRPPQPCPATFDVTVGTYPLTVMADGMRASEREYTFGAGRNFVEVEALAALDRVGTVVFECATSGVEIAMGPERFGCPATRVVEAGTWSFTALRPNAEPFDGQVQVPEGQSVVANVPGGGADVGTLVVGCDPTTASVLLQAADASSQDGAEKLACPFSAEVPAGRYDLAISADGFDTERRTVTVASGETVRMRVALAPPSSFAIAVRAQAGGGLEASKSDDSQGQTAEAGTSQGRATGIARLAVLARIMAWAPHGLQVGPVVRLGFGGDRLGLLTSGVVEWVFDQEPWRLWFGGALGYGTVGLDPCEAQNGECVVVSDEAQALHGGLGFGAGIGLGAGFAVLFGMDVVFGETSMFDLHGGLEWRM